MRNSTLCILILPLVFCCCTQESNLFTILEAGDTHLYFTNKVRDAEDLSILDYLYFYNGGGVAVGDVNNDGLPDIFFSGNRVDNTLYLNKGNMLFEDVTKIAGLAGKSDWNTGTVMADVNGDGLLDIYVCAVVGIHGLKGHNELFINNGDGTFTEEAEAYGLAFQNYSTSVGFFDYDLDGDLDMYLLNHAVHNADSFGKSSIRHNRAEKSGDKLLRNDDNFFVEVSEEAGIYGGPNGYGLGLAISDFNHDGYPDIYVCNDFHEDDYFYINNGDGTFRETGKDFFGHFSKFSMGSDAADLNNDGFPELLTLDMLPFEEKILKKSAGDDNQANLDLRTEVLGYHPQYARNMLHVNRSGRFFNEMGLMAKVAATDWSWSALFADFDMDAKQDLFVTNGIPRRPNDLDYINFISNDEIKTKLNSSKTIDVEALKKMPAGVVQNKLFKGKGLTFTDVTAKWSGDKAFISNGAAIADFDNDGDVDIVTNNLNGTPTIYRNNCKNTSFLKIRLKQQEGNTFGLGTKVYAYQGGKFQFKELHTFRGFQSSSEPLIHFGFEEISKIDSLLVKWPNGIVNAHYDVEINTTLVLTPTEENHKREIDIADLDPPQFHFEQIDDFTIKHSHKENKYNDFNRQKLIPYKISNRGPALAVGDINGDGKEDIFFGSSKHIPSSVYFHKDGAFERQNIEVILNDSITEDESVSLNDYNGDGLTDILVASGGGEFFGNNTALLDRLYLQQDGGWKKAKLPKLYVNTSVIRPHDMDNDGDLDLFVGVYAEPSDFGKPSTSFLLINQNGSFEVQNIDALENIGMITDAVWTDFDGDQIKDLIVVGEWMSPVFLKNNGKTLSDVSPLKLNQKLGGLWRAVHAFDIDKDGDLDYLLGNWGCNSKFVASSEHPMKMYYGDLDGNQTHETVVAIYKDGSYFPINGLNELSGQMESLVKRKFTNYESFAGTTIDGVIAPEALKNATLFEVNTLASGFLRNVNGNFHFEELPQEVQIAPVNCFLSYDFDQDGKQEVLAAGNFFGSEPFHGQFDGFSGAVLYNEEKLMPGHEIGLNFSNKVVTDLQIITIGNHPVLVAPVNNGTTGFYKLVFHKP